MHVPVLLDEVIENLNAKKGGKFVDATAASRGHTNAILAANSQNEVLAIDLDPTDSTVVFGNYKNIDKLLEAKGWEKVDGILVDLGFSSLQLDQPERGLKFAALGPLDMRYDKNQTLTAGEVVMRYHPKDLERVIKEFGEEHLSHKIVEKIVAARKLKPIQTTTELAQIIRSAVPLPVRFKADNNIRRTFQAIRIEVNHELENLKQALPKMLDALNPKGRLAVISFHSLEDRIVKKFFAKESKDCVCPPEFPTCICDKTSSLRIITRKPITPSEQEILNNPRSKSAKLRVAEKK